MIRTIITCDFCDRGDDDGIKAVSYHIYSKKGTDGWLTDYDKLDMCHDCWKKYVEEHKDTKEIFPEAHWF
jgi:hypothetical protein